MSYNIDNIDVTGTLICTQEGKDEFLKDCPEGFEECSFKKVKDLPGFFKVIVSDWIHDGSGYGYDRLKECLKLTTGEADLILIWEGGDTVGGLRVKNGKVTEHKVIQALGDKI